MTPYQMKTIEETLEFLRSNEWEQSAYDRGGDYYSYCGSCLGSEYSSMDATQGHRDDCNYMRIRRNLENLLKEGQ